MLGSMRPRQAVKSAQFHLLGSYNEAFAAERLPQRQLLSVGCRGRTHPAQVLVVTCLFSLLSAGLHGFPGSQSHAFGLTCGARWACPHVVPSNVRQRCSLQLRLSAGGGQATRSSEDRPQFPKLTATEQQDLREGCDVQSQEREGREGSILFVTEIHAPSETVFNKLQTFESYPEMIPSVRWAEVQARDPTGACSYDAQAQYRVSRFGLTVAVVHSVDDAARTVGFKLDESCVTRLVLQEASGAWLVETAPGGNANRSRVSFQMKLKASPWLPLWLVNYAAKRAMWRATFWLKPYMEEKHQDSEASGLLKEQD